MRRFLTILALALFAMGPLSGTAAAKEGVVDVSSTPAGKEPGEPWTPTLLVVESPELLGGGKPSIVIENVETGERIRYPATATDNPGLFTVEVVFPEAGWWTARAFDGISSRAYPIGGQWLIDGPEAAPPPLAGPSPTKSSFPIWPAVGGGITFLLAAAGAALLFRRQRFGLLH